jgi:predicted signal transduction protein with EAL and GGDEF domain
VRIALVAMLSITVFGAVVANGLLAATLLPGLVVLLHIVITPTAALTLSVACIAGCSLALALGHPETSLAVAARLVLSSVGATVAMQLAARHWQTLVNRLRQLGREVADAVESMESRLRSTQDEAQQARLQDPGTGLPSQEGLEAALQARLDRGRSPDGVLAIVRLSQWTASSAHLDFAEQQALTRRLVSRLNQSAGDEALVARVGPADFAVWIEYPDSPVTGIDDIDPVAQRLDILMRSLSEPLTLGTLTALTGPRVGVSQYPQDGRQASTLLRKARQAAEHASRRQSSEPCLFDERVAAESATTRELATQLGRSIRAGEFEPLFQPVWMRQSQGPRMAVMHPRWRHPTQGPMEATDLRGVMERASAEDLLDHLLWSLRKASMLVAEWRRHAPDMRIVVPLPLKRLLSDFPHRAEALGPIARIDTLPRSVVLSIEESALVGGMEAPVEAMHWLRGHGFQVALERFGIGLSSFHQLHRLPLDMVCIDRSFTETLDQGGRAAAIAQAIVEVGHGLGLQVWADQVASEAQFRKLLELGCDGVQGPWIGPALDAQAWNKHLQGR